MARSTLPESGEGLRVIHSASQAVASPSPQESPTAPIDAQQVHRSEEPDALVAHVRIGIDPVLWTQMPLQIRRVKGCPHVKKTSSVGQVPGCGVKAMILSKMGGMAGQRGVSYSARAQQANSVKLAGLFSPKVRSNLFSLVKHNQLMWVAPRRVSDLPQLARTTGYHARPCSPR